MLILLDRDGVLNRHRPDFVKSPAELELIPGAAAAVARLNRAGHHVVVCTNQSCIGRGIIDMTMLERIHACLREALAAAGAHLDDILVAPDPPWAATAWRKPAPGMLREAMRRQRAAPADTVYVGDTLTDLQAAAAAGCRRILVRTGEGAETQARGLPPELLPVEVCADLAEAAGRLLGEARP
jgi:D-glycero-D-manno-heptose 1,7-bisphosphate phosphatase